MKRSFSLILFSFLVTVMPLAASAQKHVFQKVADMPEVESVFVGSAILKMADGVSKVTGYNKYTRSVKNIESIEVISCESPNAIPNVVAECRRIIDSMGLEVILEANESDEQSMIYGGPIVEGQATMSSLIVTNIERNEFSLVYIRGDINISDVVSGFW